MAEPCRSSFPIEDFLDFKSILISRANVGAGVWPHIVYKYYLYVKVIYKYKYCSIEKIFLDKY